MVNLNKTISSFVGLTTIAILAIIVVLGIHYKDKENSASLEKENNIIIERHLEQKSSKTEDSRIVTSTPPEKELKNGVGIDNLEKPEEKINKEKINKEKKLNWDYRTGILWLADVDCSLEKGECRPDHISSPDMTSYIPLLGDFNKEHSGLIIQVKGEKVNLSYQEIKELFGLLYYDGPTEIIKVNSYSLLSKIPYHDFLVKKANEYTVEKYPCLGNKSSTFWNKTFSWEVKENTPILKVRMTYNIEGNAPLFYELWYDGNTGDFIKEIKSSDEVSCPFWDK